MRKKAKSQKTDKKIERVKHCPLISSSMMSVFDYIAKGHHIKYACTLGGVNRADFYRYIDEARNKTAVKYATPDQQKQFLANVELANASYVDNRLDALKDMREGNLNPSIFRQVQWELSIKDKEVYSQAAHTKVEIQNQTNPLLEVWQSILNQKGDE